MYFPNQANHPDQFDQSHSAKSDTQKNRSTKVGKKIKYESVLNLQLIWKRNPLFFYRYFSGVDGRVEQQLVESDCGSFGAVSEKHFQRLQKCRPRHIGSELPKVLFKVLFWALLLAKTLFLALFRALLKVPILLLELYFALFCCTFFGGTFLGTFLRFLFAFFSTFLGTFNSKYTFFWHFNAHFCNAPKSELP